MNLFVYFLIRISISYCTKPSRDAEIVVLYEYDAENDKSNNQDFLYKIELSYNLEKKYEFLLNSSIQKPFFNFDKSKRYEHLPDNMSKEIIKNTAVAADVVYYQAYNFIFANPSKKEKRSYKTYVTGGPHGLKNDTEYIYTKHIEKNIRSFLNKRLLIAKDFCTGTKKEALLNNTNFKLQFFKSYSECIDSLSNFSDCFNYFKLVKDNTKTSTDRVEHLITVSKLRNSLKEKLDDHFKDVDRRSDLYKAFYSNNSNSSGSKIYQVLCEHLETRLLSRNVFLPMLGRDDNVNSYMEVLFNHILSITKKHMLRRFGLKDSEVISNDNLKKDFDTLINELTEEKINRIFNCELNYLCRLFFSKIIKYCSYQYEKNEFLIELEKVICDYYNIIECIMNKDDRDHIVYIEPIVFGKTCHKIIKALEINLTNCNKFKHIKFFNETLWDEILEQENYVFYKNKLYLMFYVIKEHNIKKISIFSENDSLMKVINVEEHAYHNMESVLETEYDTTSACSIS